MRPNKFPYLGNDLCIAVAGNNAASPDNQSTGTFRGGTRRVFAVTAETAEYINPVAT